MPKSAVDATRFTSTTPHASAKPPPSPFIPSSGTAPLPNSSTISLPHRPPSVSGETPQQRVRRLREAAARTRNAKISPFDRFLVRGRVWADRAHRFTALTLIGITGVAGVVTVYALGDMMIYNRRKRREYFAEQAAVHDSALYEAWQAIRQGRATEAQAMLITKEEELLAKAALANTPKPPGLFRRTRERMFRGLKKEEEEGEDFGTAENRLGYDGLSEEDERLGTRDSDVLRAIEEKREEVRGSMLRAMEREKELKKSGGPLDRLGTESAGKGAPIADGQEETPKKMGGGWAAFLGRG